MLREVVLECLGFLGPRVKGSWIFKRVYGSFVGIAICIFSLKVQSEQDCGACPEP